MNIKRIIAGISACVCVFGAMPVNGYISGNSTALQAQANDAGGEYEIADGIKATLGAGGVLTISGTGTIPKAEYVFDISIVEKLVIEDGITAVGDRAFIGFKNLKSVEMADSVIEIGDSAFSRCTFLEELKLSKYLEHIGSSALSWTKLTSIKLPDSLKKIGSFCFQCCSELSNVEFGDGLTDIGMSSFARTPWLEAQQEADPFVTVKGFLIDGTTCSGDVVIPDSVRYIGDGAFYHNKNITSVTFPENVERICGMAFTECTELKEVKLPDTVSVIEPWVFKDCTALESIDLRNITSIGGNAFAGCTRLKNVELSDKLTDIWYEAFSGCDALEEINIPASVANINQWAFSGTPWLARRASEDPQVVVNGILIDGMSCVGDVVINDSVKLITFSAAQKNEKITKLTISGNVERVDYFAFSGCPNLTVVSIEDGVKELGACAFSNNAALKEVTIPASVEQMDDNAFDNCSEELTIFGYAGSYAETYANEHNIKFELIPEESTVTFDMSQDNILRIRGTGIARKKDLTIPKDAINGVIVEEGITAIGDDLLAECVNLRSAQFPGTLKTIGKSAFSGCTALKDITFEEGLVKINDYAFAECKSLVNVPLPESLDEVGFGAFVSCENLEEAPMKNVTRIGGWAFHGCTKLVSGFGFKVRCVGRYAFEGVNFWEMKRDDGTSIKFNAGVIMQGVKTAPDYNTKQSGIMYTIAGGAFAGDTVLENVTIDTNITHICEEAFADCTNLKTITIPNSVIHMGENIFRGCTSLEKIRCFEGSMADLYARTHRLPVEYIEADVAEEVQLCDNASYKLYSNGRLVITGEGEISYDKKAIKMYDKFVTSVEIGEGITNIPSSLFFSCAQLTDVKLPESLLTIDSGAFMGCTALEHMKFPSGLVSIGEMAFMACEKLSEVSGANRINNVGALAFYLTPLQDEQLDSKGYASMNGVLYSMKCEEGGTVVVPDGIRIIGEGAFYGEKLKALVIPEGVECLRDGICADSTVETITVPESVTAFSDDTFSGCESLTMIYGKSGSAVETYAKEHNIPFTATDAPAAEYKTGDVDGNGRVDAADASKVLVEYSKLSTGNKGDFTEAQTKAADVNGDGFVNSNDASAILVFYSYVSTGGEILDMAEWLNVK